MIHVKKRLKAITNCFFFPVTCPNRVEEDSKHTFSHGWINQLLIDYKSWMRWKIKIKHEFSYPQLRLLCVEHLTNQCCSSIQLKWTTPLKGKVNNHNARRFMSKSIYFFIIVSSMTCFRVVWMWIQTQGQPLMKNKLLILA